MAGAPAAGLAHMDAAGEGNAPFAEFLRPSPGIFDEVGRGFRQRKHGRGQPFGAHGQIALRREPGLHLDHVAVREAPENRRVGQSAALIAGGEAKRAGIVPRALETELGEEHAPFAIVCPYARLALEAASLFRADRQFRNQIEHRIPDRAQLAVGQCREVFAGR